ncbi:MAG TPA: PH domain-containing protein [Micromonosporaceae bacterium]|nr:PH domain-containing protein [Micromonosporaceae bacterium]
MELRSGGMSESDHPGRDTTDQAAPTALSWRVSPALTLFKGIGALVFIGAAALFVTDAGRLLMAGFAAVLLVAFAVRDLVAPVRLAADADGITVVAGYAGRRRIPWSGVERVLVDERRRLGTRSQLLEVDTGESLHLFSTYELNAPVHDVADALNRLRPS